MAMLCPYHSSSGSGAHGSGGMARAGGSPKTVVIQSGGQSMQTTTNTSSTTTCDNCGAMMCNIKSQQTISGGSGANQPSGTGMSVVGSNVATLDWETTNKEKFKLADKEKGLAEQLRNEAWRAVKATDREARIRQAANTKRLDDRLSDIAMWREELLAEINADSVEMDNMKEFIRALEMAMNELSSPLTICQECLTQRENRTGVDKIRDEVELALLKELETIKRCQEKMKNMIEKVTAHQKETRAAQHACEMDARNKQHCHNIDERMHQLHNASSGLGRYPGIETYDNTLSVPASWQQFTQENLERARKKREFSMKLRGEMDLLMKTCATDVWNQFNCVNNALNARVLQTKNAIAKLHDHMQKTGGEAKEMERTVAYLRKAIRDKEDPLKVAETRLAERTRRVDVELCKDPAMLGLQKEIEELREAIRVLEAKLQEAEEALMRLRTARSSLEQDIQTKERSLDIDSKICLGMRKRMATDPKSCPMITVPLSVC